MRDPFQSSTMPIKADNARDLQASLYREIGISAVAAALRFTTQPEPGLRQPEAKTPADPSFPREGIAA